jgi:hypothetical protein
MQEFRLDKKLPSALITKDLIKSIETYLYQRATDLRNDASDKKESIVQEIKITDSLGTETIVSIDEYAPIKFPDTTKAIEVVFKGPNWGSNSSIDVNIQFSKERDSSRMRISYTGTNARALVNGIAEGISGCLSTHRTRNAWFHLGMFGDMIPFFLGFVSIALSLAILFSWIYIGPHHVRIGILFLNFTLIVLFYNISKQIRPFSTFDSNRSDLYGKIWNFFFAGLLGLIIFGILFQKYFDWIFSHS